MQTKISFFISISISILLMNGCIIAPLPEKIRDVPQIINSESVENIARDHSDSGSINQIKDKRIFITFKNDVCPCSSRRDIRMKVTEVDSMRVKGYEKTTGSELRIPTMTYDEVKKALSKQECKTTVIGEEAISAARNSSKRGRYFYPPSYNLIWAAETAIGPPECDGVRAKILADKAKQVAEEEGAKVLGYNLTGIYISEITGSHPVITKYFGENGNLEPRLTIEQRGNRITGTDSSGNAILKGSRFEDTEFNSAVEFKFSFPSTFKTELKGEWVIRDDGLGMEGFWEDPASDASGGWNLWKAGQKIKAEKYGKRTEKMVRKWLSQKPPLEIKLEEIRMMRFTTKDVDWMWCFGTILQFGQCW